MRFFTCTKI